MLVVSSSAASAEKYKAPRISAGATRNSASPHAAGGSGPVGSPAASAAGMHIQDVDAEWLGQHNAAMFAWFKVAEAEMKAKGVVSTPAPGILTGFNVQSVDTFDPAVHSRKEDVKGGTAGGQ
jgi:hypothetical protein